MPCSAVVLVLLGTGTTEESTACARPGYSGNCWASRAWVIGDVTVQADPDGDGEILVVSVRPDARSAGRCAQCRRSCPGYDPGVGTRRWRTVDTGTTRTFLEAAAPRVRCPEHGVLVAH